MALVRGSLFNSSHVWAHQSDDNVSSKSVGLSQRHKFKPSHRLELSLFPSRNILKGLSEQKVNPKAWRFARPGFPALLKAERLTDAQLYLWRPQAKFENLEQPGQLQAL